MGNPIDYSKFVLHSGTSAFMASYITESTFTISGSLPPGVSILQTTITLPDKPAIVDFKMKGLGTDGTFDFAPPDPFTRPSNRWFRQGYLWVPANDGFFTAYPVPFQVFANFSNSRTLNIYIVGINTTGTTMALTSSVFYMRTLTYVST